MKKREAEAERRKFWVELIARHKQSGKTVEAFCQENGVGSPLFYTWRKRLALVAQREEGKPMAFALVEPAGTKRGEPVELTLASGDRLRISPGTDAATLRLVLGVLRELR